MWTQTTFCYKDLLSRECFAQIFSTFFPSRSSILRAKIIMISPLYLLWTFLSLYIFWLSREESRTFFWSVMSRIIKLDGKCHRRTFRVLWIVGLATCLARVCVRLCPSFWSSSCFYGSFVKVLHFKGQCVQKVCSSGRSCLMARKKPSSISGRRTFVVDWFFY